MTRKAVMQPQDARLLRGALLATGVAVPVAAGIGFAAQGRPGLAGALLGLVIVAAFFTSSMLVMSVMARVSPRAMLGSGVVTYVVKILALGGVLVGLQDVQGIDSRALGWSVFAGTILWVAAEVRLFLTARILYVDPVRSGPTRSDLAGSLSPGAHRMPSSPTADSGR